MKIAIIVATDEQGVIGKDNDLPWRISADLQYFKKVTMGKPLIMGRNTHESIGRPLPGRRNIVVTSQTDYVAEGCEVVNSIEAALASCADDEEVMIMGGASIYQQTLPLADRLYLTQVHAKVEGDTWFPTWSPENWKAISEASYPADEKNEYDYSFKLLERIQHP
jgi:dihydrofolate reductase